MCLRRIFSISFCMFFLVSALCAEEYHVSVKGSDQADGSRKTPFRTIGRAARAAGPGDIITVHGGTYREWVNPPKGGADDRNRITYRAAEGECVEIKGSERIQDWVPVPGHKGIWKAIVPDSVFGSYNPYIDTLHGDWFYTRYRKFHTGEVFLNGKSFYEVETLEKVYHPAPLPATQDPEGSLYTWYCSNDGGKTTLWANFHSYNPNRELTEISARPYCFYPSREGINYLTLSGFHISQAATQWAAPTDLQTGIVATHWSKGWIIENNVISNSKCSGIVLGKTSNADRWAERQRNAGLRDGTLHYIEVVFSAVRQGWSKENIGHHIVRNNTISHCEQTGICGSMGAAFSLIENNHIYDIWTKRQFRGAETGGIKLHAAIDTRIVHNRIHNTGRGLWLDWMAQGTIACGNLLYDNDSYDLWLEVNHGPYLFSNNILASRISIREQSQGGAFVHNTILGRVHNFKDGFRQTPYFLPHSTDVAGYYPIYEGDARYYNNVFAAAEYPKVEKEDGWLGLKGYENTRFPSYADGNLYYGQAIPFAGEKHGIRFPGVASQAEIVDEGNKVYLLITVPEPVPLETEIINSGILGRTRVADQRYENPDGTDISISRDYMGNLRKENPFPGAVESLESGKNRIRIW